MRICTTCFLEKPHDDFYAHSNKCKPCTRAAVKKNRDEKRLQYSEYERCRFKDPDRKQAVADYQRKRRARSPGKGQARGAVMWAIRRGWMKPKPCEICGTKDGIEAHHDDYDKPLEVRWFCFKHHREEAHGQVVVAF